MRWFMACGVLCFIAACSSPESYREARKPPLPKPGSKPVQVTTRSGTLRQPGPEPPADFDEAATPTFLPEVARLSSEPPQGFPQLKTRELKTQIPQGNRAPMRDSSVTRAEYERPQDKPTMASWLKDLWTGKKQTASPSVRQKPTTSTGSTSIDQYPTSKMKEGSSIDPRRVYRGPKPEEEIDESRRGSRFSETGVPQTGTEFRGRADSAF